MVEYSGRRDARFIRIHRGGLLDEARHRLLAAWAAECVEHVLPLFASQAPEDDRPRRAVEVARAWSLGKASVLQAREAAYAAHAAAREVSDHIAGEVARAAGHAAATAHMADHELGAAGYALRAVRLAAGTVPTDVVLDRERRWQLQQLPDAIRDLVVSDMERRAQKFQALVAGRRK